VPDFDQRQDNWVHPSTTISTYCGPVAAANSLWWFDSKFEPYPVGPQGGLPPTLPYNDNYYLVTSYSGTDDHDPQNVIPFVSDLAWYFDTDGQRTNSVAWMGTEVHTMSYGLQWYLYGGNPAWVPSPHGPRYGSYYDDYHVQLVKMPTFEWVEEEVERSEDVVLLLGFWQWQTDQWVRLGGHYVTVPGINSDDLQIAFSDPFFDNAEAGGPGRVLSGTLIPHTPIPGHGAGVHNDAGNVSHDIYTVTLDVHSPSGLWEIEDYPYVPGQFREQNCPLEFEKYQGDPTVGPSIYTEVEYALAMSPFYWKPGGEWVWQWYEGEWMWEWWWYKDDGDSCLPDFWWRLDDWNAYDGPATVANSLWWFDSKAETLKTGGWPTEPPTVSDHYNLIVPYGEWDDHAISNTVPFIEDLAKHYLDTGPQGTTIVSMTTGIGAYLTDSGMADDFYTKTQEAPSFEWVADEVETCEDVILLLGFYEDIGGGNWRRLGGHWANAAGVNRESRLIGLSDPALNNAVSLTISSTMHLGRVFPPEHLGTPFTATEQRAPQKISHDIYRVVTSTSPGGQWALVDYPASSVITDFIGLNGGDYAEWAGNPISTEVEWAIGVSPYSDLVLTKTAVVTEVVPGDRVTYTLEYANTGLAAVNSVTLTDVLPLNHLTSITYTSRPPLAATQAVTYVWTLPRLSYGLSGTITITAESLVTATLTNTAYITGLNSIGGPTPDRNPNNNTGTVCTPVDVTAVDYAPPSPHTGQTVHFTATATGSPAINYTWDFGDSATGSGATTQHGYSQANTYTVWVTATNPCGQDTFSTTITISGPPVTYGVELTPPAIQQTGNPGDAITHTLTVRNTGNVTDSYTLSKSGDTWTTVVQPTAISDLSPGDTADVQVYVTIPSSGVSEGDSDTIAVTAASQNSTPADSSVLTTSVTMQTITRDVSVAASVTGQTGIIGTWVTYTLRVTNTGNVADSFNLTRQGNTWTVDLSAYGLSLGAGQVADIHAYVQIPLTAGDGVTDTATVKATSANDATVTDEVALTTTARWRRIYLPLVMRNHQ